MEVKKLLQVGYEEVWEAREPRCQFHGIIALHNLNRGPALGGIRFWDYASEKEALEDALRLARSMTYKAAVADLPHGGGKGVMLLPTDTFDRQTHMELMGQFIQKLDGRYIAAKDVGTQAEDMKIIRSQTPWVTGLPEEDQGAGDPSPLTAYGVLIGIQATMTEMGMAGKWEELRVGIQGLGGVGRALARLLIEKKVHVLGSDISKEKMKFLAELPGFRRVPAEDMLTRKVDIMAPCAMGQEINPQSIPKLKCKAIAGSANDQLEVEERDSLALQKRGILYAPDFVINSGGLIHVASDFKGYDPIYARKKTEEIGPTLKEIYALARNKETSTWEAAFTIADSRL